MLNIGCVLWLVGQVVALRFVADDVEEARLLWGAYLGLQNRSVRPLAALVSVCVNNNGSDR